MTSPSAGRSFLELGPCKFVDFEVFEQTVFSSSSHGLSRLIVIYLLACIFDAFAYPPCLTVAAFCKILAVIYTSTLRLSALYGHFSGGPQLQGRSKRPVCCCALINSGNSRRRLEHEGALPHLRHAR